MVRTRFAPSPTGYLHIGGVRTALFNWLLARQAGGQFILRIDDTDKKRNLEESLAPILEGFRWLGLDWDEGPDVGGPHAPYYQSQRTERYQQAVAEMLSSGSAYRDYSFPEEYQKQKEASSGPFVYDRQWKADTDEQAELFEAEGRSHVVRLNMPDDGACCFRDLVKGELSFQWIEEADHVIQRGDGSPLYHLATVVDDHDFEITHVVRAAEQLSNTPRQIFIYEALRYDVPEFGHLPVVAEPGGSRKLSKRKLKDYLKNPDFAKLMKHGQQIADRLATTPDQDLFNPVIVDFYRDTGFLPDAIINYLLLLGWSLDDKKERFTREEMLEHFSLDRVNRAPASFDPQKMLAFQSTQMMEHSPAERTDMAMPFLLKAGWIAEDNPTTRGRVQQIVSAAGDRLKVAGDITDYQFCFVDDEHLQYNEKDVQKRILKPAEAKPLLQEFSSVIDSLDGFDAQTTETALKGFVEAKEIKIGQIIHALRVATTGQSVGFGMFETLEVLGKPAVQNRIRQALNL